MERRIDMDGITNFRDLGGYKTADGATVQWGKIFRSDTLAWLTDHDMKKVCDLGVTTACDLRYGEERQNEPNRFLNHDQVEVLELGLEERPNAGFLDSFEAPAEFVTNARQFLLTSYDQYPVLYADAYRTIMDRLIDGHKLIIHCTAGKDRAGTASAMVLTALGVPRETVLEDYMLTNEYWNRSGREIEGVDPAALDDIFSARVEYFETAFRSIDKNFGDVETYLTKRLGLDTATRDALKAACLE
jgi:protein-tyrosine phosphatase